MTRPPPLVEALLSATDDAATWGTTLARAEGGIASADICASTGWPVQRPPLLPGPLAMARVLIPAALQHYRCSATRLEAMPASAHEVLACVERTEMQLIDFVALVQRERAVAGELVRVANSPLFRGQSPIASVRDAVIRIGLEEASRVASLVASRALFRARSERLYALRPALWDELSHHGLCTAYGAAWLAKKLKVAEAGTAFLAGLFHQIGKAVALHALLEMLTLTHVPFSPDDEACRLVLDAIHHEMGAEQLLHFNMPREVISICIHATDLDVPAEPRYALHHVIRVVSGLLEMERRSSEAPHLAHGVQRGMLALSLPITLTTRLHHEMASLADKVGVILDQPVRASAARDGKPRP